MKVVVIGGVDGGPSHLPIRFRRLNEAHEYYSWNAENNISLCKLCFALSI